MLGGLMLWGRRRLAAIPGLRRLARRSPLLQSADLLFRRLLRAGGNRNGVYAATPDGARAAALYGASDQAIELGLQVIRRGEGDADFHRSLADWLTRSGRLRCHAADLLAALERDAHTLAGEAAEEMSAVLSSLGMEVLSHNGLDECRPYFGLASKVAPNAERRLCVELMDYLIQARDAANAAGRERVGQIAAVLGYTVWGADYVEAFMGFHVRSLLAPGNLPRLAGHGRVMVRIVTPDEDRVRIEAHPQYQRLAAVAEIGFVSVPAGFCARNDALAPDPLFYRIFGALDHLNLHFAAAAGCSLFQLPVDCVVADGSLARMAAWIAEGYDSCGGANLVAQRESFLPALAEAYPGDGPMPIDSKSLATLSFRHRHQYVTSQWMVPENQDFGRWPRELFWPVEGGVAAHSIYAHPLFLSARALAAGPEWSYSSVDFLLPARIFTEETSFSRFRVISDATQAYIANFAPALRRFETTGRPFSPAGFATAHRGAYPIHRHLFARRQFIPCNTGQPEEKGIEEVVAAVLLQLDGNGRRYI